MATRQIIKIDEEKCTGCGDCITSCAEGALKIIDGKARLISEIYCDGLGACLGNCPEGALTIEERDAEEFDEEAVRDHLAAQWAGSGGAAEAATSCPSARVLEFGERGAPVAAAGSGETSSGPPLGHWPIKLQLVPPGAPFLRDADVMLVADCVGFAWRDLRREVTPENAVLIGCPKFDDFGFALNRLTEILRGTDVRSLTVVHMEVPCCSGYWHLAREACAASGREVPLQKVVVGVHGEVKAVGEDASELVRIEPLQE